MEFGDRELNHVWPTCEEVNTTRGLLVGTSTGPQSPEGALAGFNRRYPGKSADIEKTLRPRVGDEPVGVGVRDAQLSPRRAGEVLARARRAARARALRRRLRRQPELGQEAATRSANRVAEAIGTT